LAIVVQGLASTFMNAMLWGNNEDSYIYPEEGNVFDGLLDFFDGKDSPKIKNQLMRMWRGTRNKTGLK
jgi:hypothetical protein